MIQRHTTARRNAPVRSSEQVTITLQGAPARGAHAAPLTQSLCASASSCSLLHSLLSPSCTQMRAVLSHDAVTRRFTGGAAGCPSGPAAPGRKSRQLFSFSMVGDHSKSRSLDNLKRNGVVRKLSEYNPKRSENDSKRSKNDMKTIDGSTDRRMG